MLTLPVFDAAEIAAFGLVGEFIMTFQVKRRSFLQMAMGGIAGLGLPVPFARAAANDAATIGWPNDVPSWDPNQRFTPDAQPIFKAVFDQPLDQDPQLAQKIVVIDDPMTSLDEHRALTRLRGFVVGRAGFTVFSDS